MQTKQLGVLYIILSSFFFALLSLFVKLAGPLPSMQKALFRNTIALIISLFILSRSKSNFTFTKQNVPALFFRSIAGTIGLIANFYAIDHLLLSDATILNKLAPFFVIIFSWMVLKENIKARQMLFILGAFIGSSLIVKPSFSNEGIFPYLVGILGGVAAGASHTSIRMLGNQKVPAPIIVAFFSLFSTIAILPFVLVEHQGMEPYQIAMMLLAGCSAAAGQFSITKAYSFAPAREISIFDYTQVLFASLFSFFIFSEFPDKITVVGYIIVTSMAILMFLYNKREASASRLSDKLADMI